MVADPMTSPKPEIILPIIRRGKFGETAIRIHPRADTGQLIWMVLFGPYFPPRYPPMRAPKNSPTLRRLAIYYL